MNKFSGLKKKFERDPQNAINWWTRHGPNSWGRLGWTWMSADFLIAMQEVLDED